jgi:hypothetical protein
LKRNNICDGNSSTGAPPIGTYSIKFNLKDK